jgi:hypothetical protein
MAITLETRNQKPEAGFTLLIAAIFMSVMLTFGLALGSLGYKQQLLASLAIESQYAFYAANSALECALWADLQLQLFPTDAGIPPSAPAIPCDGSSVPFSPPTVSPSGDGWFIEERLSLDSGAHCADVVIQKYSDGTTWIFSQGYNVPCGTVLAPSGARFVSRGISTHY